MHQLNNSKPTNSNGKRLSFEIRDLFWKIIAWLSISILVFIGYSSQNIYNGAKAGKEAKTENVLQQQQLDSVCSRTMIHQIYIEALRQEGTEYRQDIKEIKNMLIDIYKNQRSK